MKKVSAFLLFITLISILNVKTAAIVMDAKAVEGNSVFSDVDESNPNYEAIQALKALGIIQGYANGTYGSTLEMNRAEFVKILIGSITSNPQGKNCFSDVREEWFAPFICEAKARGVVQGDGKDSRFFKPGDLIKFSEAAKIVVNTYKLQKGATDQELWYKEFITGLQASKAIPLSVEYFDETVDRGEMAEMIWRLKEKVSDKASRTFDEISGEGVMQAQSCADIQNRLVPRDNYRNFYLNEGDQPVMIQDATAPTTGAPSPAMMEEKSTGATSSGNASSAQDYSHTNVQVAGVDEADVIKNDGKYIYIIKGSSIRIVEAYPAENMKELINFSFGEKDSKQNFYPTEMYVDGNTLTVIGSVSRPYIYDSTTPSSTSKMIAPDYGYYTQNRTKVYILNIANHSKPTVERFVEFDGDYNSSRKIGSTLYMVMHQSPFYGIPFYATEKRDRDITPQEFLPQMLDSQKGKDESVAPCNRIMILPKPQTPNFLITAAIPLDDTTQEVKRNVMVGDAENIYASMNNLYVASTNWQGGYRPYDQSNKSVIYRFALGKNTIEYKAQGKVPGNILNQFSMDENNGYFRVATTKNEYAMGSEIHNNLYILNDKMETVGKIEKIVPGEKIYSVRFLGNRAYMVTFKRIDPLFVIDTTDPVNPKILGKLKIPGYSTYLHPYDENHIMGFGNEVDEDMDNPEMSSEDFIYYTAVQGMKIGMFDVTDVSKPKEMFKEVIGTQGTTSQLLYNHKALLFDKEKGLLAFPVTVNEITDELQCSEKSYSTCPTSCRKICVPSSCTYENGLKVCTPDCNGENSCVEPSSANDSKPVFTGAYVYNVNLQNGFTLKGKITHLTTAEEGEMKKNGYITNYQKTIDRIIYIGQNLYTISQEAVKANDLSSLIEKKMITLAGDITDLYDGPGIPMPLQ